MELHSISFLESLEVISRSAQVQRSCTKKDARREKNLRKTLEKGKARAEEMGEEKDGDQDRSVDLDAGMDLKVDNWAKSPEGESSSHDNDESRDHTLKY